MTIPAQTLDANGRVVPGNFVPDTANTQKLGSSGTSVQSSAFTTSTLVRLVADGNCHYDIGVNPTATTSEAYLPANVGECIRIPAGYKIAVIGSSINLYVTPLRGE